MKSIFSYVCIICILSACTKKESPADNPQTLISFSIEQVNSQNDFVSEAEKFSFKEKKETWTKYPSNETSLVSDKLNRIARETTYNIELKNGNLVEMTFVFLISDWERLNNEDFILMEQIESESDLFGDNGSKWNYKSFDQEFEEFYQNPEHFRIEFGGFDILRNSSVFKVESLNLTRVVVEGEEKIYADFDFEWEAFGAYDENKELNGYIVTNGVFKGVIN